MGSPSFHSILDSVVNETATVHNRKWFQLLCRPVLITLSGQFLIISAECHLSAFHADEQWIPPLITVGLAHHGQWGGMEKARFRVIRMRRKKLPINISWVI